MPNHFIMTSLCHLIYLIQPHHISTVVVAVAAAMVNAFGRIFISGSAVLSNLLFLMCILSSVWHAWHFLHFFARSSHCILSCTVSKYKSFCRIFLFLIHSHPHAHQNHQGAQFCCFICHLPWTLCTFFSMYENVSCLLCVMTMFCQPKKEMKLAHSVNLLRQIWNSMKRALAREGKRNDEDAWRASLNCVKSALWAFVSHCVNRYRYQSGAAHPPPPPHHDEMRMREMWSVSTTHKYRFRLTDNAFHCVRLVVVASTIAVPVCVHCTRGCCCHFHSLN